jgi:hypothetical protein
MLMVIFGAGASYDSDPTRPAPIPPSSWTSNVDLGDRPPLANQLFDNRREFANELARFPACRPIVPFLRGSASIETVLEGLQREATASPAYPERHRQLAAVRYYLQMLLSGCDERWYADTRGVTNYVTLLDEIRRWGPKKVLLTTFNYDRLLERAVSDLTGHQFKTVDDYLSGEPFKIVKLHGSVNWGRVIQDPPIVPDNAWMAVSTFIDQSATLKVTSEYAVASDRPLFRDATMRPIFPAVAIPVETKQQFECPQSHLDFLFNSLPDIEKVLVIGWRGLEQHFVSLLTKHLTDRVVFQVVCNGARDSQQVATRLRDEAGLRGSFDALDYGFSGYVVQRTGAKFFSC